MPGGMVGYCFRFMDTWCGYVAIPKGHVLDGVEYSDIDLERDPHGGLTFSRRRGSGWPIFSDRPETEGCWVVGFDCAHYGDVSPTRAHEDGVYRSAAFVEREVRALGEALASYAKSDRVSP
jgi:hypothetical protein